MQAFTILYTSTHKVDKILISQEACVKPLQSYIHHNLRKKIIHMYAHEHSNTLANKHELVKVENNLMFLQHYGIEYSILATKVQLSPNFIVV